MPSTPSVTTGSFSQVWAELLPRPDATVTERTTASVDRSLRSRPSTRRDRNGSTIAISPRAGEVGHRAGAGLESAGARRVVRVDPQQHLAALEAGRLDAGGGVAGEPVVDLERGAGQAATVHRAEDHLVLERPEQQQVVEHVGGAEHAVHLGPGQDEAEPVEQPGPVGHRVGVAPGAEDAARGVVGGDDHQPAGRSEQ